ncbi:Hypothetical predicted protein [Lecanosticta acicola]|uniref:Uncharacterized protein n=1 Tax=Lecanosticta acicola TaxID=111012 RepID=A0AAI8Z962_9PEZI|nr:Hypothetical predicted protein [Lecanosticta acicola]
MARTRAQAATGKQKRKPRSAVPNSKVTAGMKIKQEITESEDESYECDGEEEDSDEINSSDEQYLKHFAGLSTHKILNGYGSARYSNEEETKIIRHAMGGLNVFLGKSLPDPLQLIALAVDLNMPLGLGNRAVEVCLDKIIDKIMNRLSDVGLKGLIFVDKDDDDEWEIKVSKTLIEKVQSGEFDFRRLKSLKKESNVRNRFVMLEGRNEMGKAALVRDAMDILVRQKIIVNSDSSQRARTRASQNLQKLLSHTSLPNLAKVGTSRYAATTMADDDEYSAEEEEAPSPVTKKNNKAVVQKQHHKTKKPAVVMYASESEEQVQQEEQEEVHHTMHEQKKKKHTAAFSKMSNMKKTKQPVPDSESEGEEEDQVVPHPVVVGKKKMKQAAVANDFEGALKSVVADKKKMKQPAAVIVTQDPVAHQEDDASASEEIQPPPVNVAQKKKQPAAVVVPEEPVVLQENDASASEDVQPPPVTIAKKKKQPFSPQHVIAQRVAPQPLGKRIPVVPKPQTTMPNHSYYASDSQDESPLVSPPLPKKPSSAFQPVASQYVASPPATDNVPVALPKPQAATQNPSYYASESEGELPPPPTFTSSAKKTTKQTNKHISSKQQIMSGTEEPEVADFQIMPSRPLQQQQLQTPPPTPSPSSSAAAVKKIAPIRKTKDKQPAEAPPAPSLAHLDPIIRAMRDAGSSELLISNFIRESQQQQQTLLQQQQAQAQKEEVTNADWAKEAFRSFVHRLLNHYRPAEKMDEKHLRAVKKFLGVQDAAQIADAVDQEEDEEEEGGKDYEGFMLSVMARDPSVGKAKKDIVAA